MLILYMHINFNKTFISDIIPSYESKCKESHNTIISNVVQTSSTMYSISSISESLSTHSISSGYTSGIRFLIMFNLIVHN